MNIPSPRAHKRGARIEIIPLIDIIFFLLATFVMVSLSMVKNRAIPVNLSAAATAAPQDRTEIAAIKIEHNGKQIRCTVSIGVAEHEPVLSFNDTIRDADRALYAAKAFGRNTVVAAEAL